MVCSHDLTDKYINRFTTLQEELNKPPATSCTNCLRVHELAKQLFATETTDTSRALALVHQIHTRGETPLLKLFLEIELHNVAAMMSRREADLEASSSGAQVIATVGAGVATSFLATPLAAVPTAMAVNVGWSYVVKPLQHAWQDFWKTPAAALTYENRNTLVSYAFNKHSSGLRVYNSSQTVGFIRLNTEPPSYYPFNLNAAQPLPANQLLKMRSHLALDQIDEIIRALSAELNGKALLTPDSALFLASLQPQRLQETISALWDRVAPHVATISAIVYSTPDDHITSDAGTSTPA